MKYNRDDVVRLAVATLFCGIVIGMSIVWLVWYLTESGVL